MNGKHGFQYLDEHLKYLFDKEYLKIQQEGRTEFKEMGLELVQS